MITISPSWDHSVGKGPKARSKQPLWNVQLGVFHSGTSYRKLASAVNAVEGHLSELKASYGTEVQIIHVDGRIETLTFTVKAAPYKARFAYHQRTYGKLIGHSV